jgi:hypothetical protein
LTFPYMCIQCTPVWFIPSIILHYSPLLKVTSAGLNIPCSCMCRKYINHIHPPLPLHFPSPCYFLPLSMTCFTVLTFILLSVCSLFSGVFPVNILYFDPSSPLHYSSLTSSPYPVCSAVFSTFCCALFLHRCDVFQYYSREHLSFGCAGV